MGPAASARLAVAVLQAVRKEPVLPFSPGTFRSAVGSRGRWRRPRSRLMSH